MKKLALVLLAICAVLPLSAETVIAHYYGSEIDLTQKNNPCKGRTDGGVEVIVVTTVTALENDPNKTMVERVYSLPNGDILKEEKEMINSTKHEVLHKLFPHNFPKITR